MLPQWFQELSVSELSNVHTYIADAKQYPMKNRGRFRHAFLYTREGTEVYHFADMTIRAVPYSVLYIPQDEPYEITLEGGRSVVTTMDFTLYPTESVRPFLLRFDRTNPVSSCFDEAERVWMQKKENYISSGKSLFYKTVSLLCTRCVSYGGTGADEKLASSVNYLREHYTDCHFRLDTLYRMAGVSPKYYTTLFRKKYQMTPKDYVTLLRIEYAKGLLTGEKQKVQDVAAASGYSDVFHFSRVFKAKTGLSPSACKKRSEASDRTEKERKD